MCHGSRLGNLQNQGKQKRAQTRSKSRWVAVAEEEQDVPVPLVTNVNNNSQSIFPQCWSVHQQSQLWNSNGLDAHKSYFLLQ